MLPLVGKVTRTENPIDGNASVSTIDAIFGERKVTTLIDTFPTQSDLLIPRIMLS